jgi:hypothetical protein
VWQGEMIPRQDRSSGRETANPEGFEAAAGESCSAKPQGELPACGAPGEAGGKGKRRNDSRAGDDGVGQEKARLQLRSSPPRASSIEFDVGG